MERSADFKNNSGNTCSRCQNVIHYKIKILEKTKRFIQSLNEKDRAKTAAAITVLSYGDFQSVTVKSLRGPIKELIIKAYRIIFFAKNETLWFVSGFRKKTRKTPLYEIESAQKILDIISLDNER